MLDEFAEFVQNHQNTRVVTNARRKMIKTTKNFWKLEGVKTRKSKAIQNYYNPFSPSLTQTGHFIILLRLTPDDFTRQGRASGWERVNVASTI